MGFEPEYTRSITDQRDIEISKIIISQKEKGEKPNGHNTILPFFGYEWDTALDVDVSNAIVIPNNEIVITHKYGNTYQVRERPDKIVGAHYTRYEKYSRHISDFVCAPEPLKELENKFVTLFNEKKKDIWSSTYIHSDLEEYYKEERSFKEGILYFLGILGLLFSAVVFLLTSKFWQLYYSWLVWLDENALGYIVAFSILCFILAFVTGSQTFSKKSEGYKNKLRKKYYKRMFSAYGDEMGAILKEYSIIRAKKEKKMY